MAVACESSDWLGQGDQVPQSEQYLDFNNRR